MLRLDFKRFRFNHIKNPTLLVHRGSKYGFTNKSRNAMFLTYNFVLYSEVIRKILHPFFSSYIRRKKDTAG